MATTNRYKVTPDFKKAIKALLDKRAAADPQFAEKYNNEESNKTLTECCEYIVSRAFAKKINAATPQEVEGWAVHYYDEEKVDFLAAPESSRVVVPATDAEVERAMGELTDEEKQSLTERAREKFVSMKMHEMNEAATKRKQKPKAKPEAATLPFVEQSLF